jgi:flavodoxin I
MKVLIAYFSQTGNTEMVAKAVRDQSASGHEVDLKTMREIAPDQLSGYDLVFVGTPIHAGGMAGDVKKFVSALPASSAFSVAGLVTHSSDLYTSAAHERGIQDLEQICRSKSINYLGSFHCQGKLDPKIQPMVQKMQNAPDDEWKKRMDETDKHPSDQDLADARAFADRVMLNISAGK